MPNKRSMAAWTGWRRTRDEWYRSAHSSPGKKFVKVSANLARPVKDMARSLELHSIRERQTGRPTHFARIASFAALASGAISVTTLGDDLKTHARANRAKHDLPTLSGDLPASIPRIFNWADCNADEVLDDSMHDKTMQCNLGDSESAFQFWPWLSAPSSRQLTVWLPL